MVKRSKGKQKTNKIGPVEMFLNPRNDFAFKRIFGAEKNKDILIHFLNDILERKNNPIEKVKFLKTIQDPETIVNGETILDIMCSDREGNRFIVEMQVDDKAGFEKRAQYYTAKAYVQQRERGMKYKDLKPIAFLAITDYTLFPGKPDVYLSHHNTLDIDTHAHALKDLSFSFLELSKFHKTKDELTSMIDKWAYFFKHAQDTLIRDLDTIAGSDIIIKRAYEELDQFAWSEAEFWEYEGREMKRISMQTTVEERFNEGLEKGMTKGREEGLVEGMKAVALRMLQETISLDVISRATKLSQREIENIKNG